MPVFGLVQAHLFQSPWWDETERTFEIEQQGGALPRQMRKQVVFRARVVRVVANQGNVEGSFPDGRQSSGPLVKGGADGTGAKVAITPVLLINGEPFGKFRCIRTTRNQHIQ